LCTSWDRRQARQLVNRLDKFRPRAGTKRRRLLECYGTARGGGWVRRETDTGCFEIATGKTFFISGFRLQRQVYESHIDVYWIHFVHENLYLRYVLDQLVPMQILPRSQADVCAASYASLCRVFENPFSEKVSMITSYIQAGLTRQRQARPSLLVAIEHVGQVTSGSHRQPVSNPIDRDRSGVRTNFLHYLPLPADNVGAGKPHAWPLPCRAARLAVPFNVVPHLLANPPPLPVILKPDRVLRPHPGIGRHLDQSVFRVPGIRPLAVIGQVAVGIVIPMGCSENPLCVAGWLGRGKALSRPALLPRHRLPATVLLRYCSEELQVVPRSNTVAPP
jgi:hypothetical protein